MKTSVHRTVLVAAAAGWLWGGAALVRGDVKVDQYLSIAERNAFRLTPAPPPPSPEPANKGETKPGLLVKLTGITTILSRTKVLAEVTEGPGKTAKKLVMIEGEPQEGVEVMSVDIKKNSVTFKIGEVVTNMTFEVAKSGPAPAGGAAPVHGVPGVKLPTGAAIPPPPAAPAASSAIVVGGGGTTPGTGGGGVVVAGGNAGVAPAATAGGVAHGTPMSYGASGGTPSVNLATPGAEGGLRTIPSRVPRIAMPGMAQPQQAEDAAVKTIIQYSTMKQTEEALRARGIAAPPTPPLMPGMDGPPPIPGQQ